MSIGIRYMQAYTVSILPGCEALVVAKTLGEILSSFDGVHIVSAGSRYSATVEMDNAALSTLPTGVQECCLIEAHEGYTLL
ncbi:hypothetical protein D1823_19700 (plasmid) [Ruegeria sp. AD91A]|nr:hypothetical protein D1823_19700 [Ruegeria sp. AD91A]